jgi:hypothetical protein
VGALDLYRNSLGTLDAHALDVAQTLADVAAGLPAERPGPRAGAGGLRATPAQRPARPPTGLPNRALLQQRIEHAAQQATRSHTTAAVLFVDLDGLKMVNDTYGHTLGDELLTGVVARLAAVVRPGDTASPASPGDEFVVLCEPSTSPTSKIVSSGCV